MLRMFRSRRRRQRRVRLWLVLAFCCFTATLVAQEAAKVAWDFEKQALSHEWTAGGKIQATRAVGEPAEKPKPLVAGDLLPGGQVAVIDAQPGSFFALKPGLAPVDWERAERFSLWLSRSEEEAKRDPACTFDLLFLDHENRVAFSRRCELKGSGWQQLEVSTAWIAPATGRVGSWQKVQRFALAFREESHLAVDALQADLAARPRPALVLADILPIAFPGVALTAIKIANRDGLLVATNATDCDPEKVAEVLLPIARQVANDLPLLEAAPPATLLIFATRDEFQKFPPRLAEKYGKESAAPQGDGFTMLGWATSSWDAKQGAERPVFVHEFIHSLIESRLRIANQGEWFQEGLATYYQLQRFPQRNVGELIHGNIAREQFDLKALTSGKPVATTSYWQAATLCSLLLRDPAYQPQLGDLIAAFQKRENTELEPHLKPVLKVSFEQLTKDWKKHCREAWPVK